MFILRVYSYVFAILTCLFYVFRTHKKSYFRDENQSSRRGERGCVPVAGLVRPLLIVHCAVCVENCFEIAMTCGRETEVALND